MSLYDHNASSKRHLPMRVHCMDPSPPKSRWDAYIRDEPSGEKRREGERGESITQRAEQRLLPLTDLAEQSGLLDDGGAPLHAACLVGAQGGHWLALVGEATSQDEGIFQGLTSPLTEVRGGGMSGIAQQGHPATSPVTHWPAIEEIVAQDGLLVGGLDQAPDGLPPAPKESGEPRLLFPCAVLFACRAVERGIPEHPPFPIGSIPKRRPLPHVSLEMPGDTCCSSKRATPRQQV